jgi:hypothetical protein
MLLMFFIFSTHLSVCDFCMVTIRKAKYRIRELTFISANEFKCYGNTNTGRAATLFKFGELHGIFLGSKNDLITGGYGFSACEYHSSHQLKYMVIPV